MLGYELAEVEDMKEAILRAKQITISESERGLLQDAFDLLDGLIVEGYIEGEDNN